MLWERRCRRRGEGPLGGQRGWRSACSSVLRPGGCLPRLDFLHVPVSVECIREPLLILEPAKVPAPGRQMAPAQPPVTAGAAWHRSVQRISGQGAKLESGIFVTGAALAAGAGAHHSVQRWRSLLPSPSADGAGSSSIPCRRRGGQTRGLGSARGPLPRPAARTIEGRRPSRRCVPNSGVVTMGLRMTETRNICFSPPVAPSQRGKTQSATAAELSTSLQGRGGGRVRLSARPAQSPPPRRGTKKHPRRVPPLARVAAAGLLAHTQASTSSASCLAHS